MTEYDLETKKALRRVSLLEYGFGPETLRGRKICPACGRGNGAYRTDCISCGAALPKETLYDFYRARHRCCPGCGVVVTDVAVYCPECGTRLSKETGAKGRLDEHFPKAGAVHLRRNGADAAQSGGMLYHICYDPSGGRLACAAGGMQTPGHPLRPRRGCDLAV